MEVMLTNPKTDLICYLNESGEGWIIDTKDEVDVELFLQYFEGTEH